MEQQTEPAVGQAFCVKSLLEGSQLAEIIWADLEFWIPFLNTVCTEKL